MTYSYSDQILNSRRSLKRISAAAKRAGHSLSQLQKSPDAAEGGCGVLGFAANLPLSGRHVLSASRQMHNRGNGKGGGIAMVGLDAVQACVDAETLGSHYLMQIAMLDPNAREDVERDFILPNFEVAQAYQLPHLDDYRDIPGLEVQPPDVWRYFVRVKSGVLSNFADGNGLQDLPARALEDEFVYQNTYKLNLQFYASLGEKRAFVLSHGRNLSVLKIVGYAEDVVEYYQLEDQRAHVWIAHQRYPTKGRVWHPGGAHPFIGLNEALVHNGDFANYHAVSEYLRQRNIEQLFLTDTEVSVQLFDLWDRVYNYPLEITLEAMAPTTEHDFAMLPAEKQALYRTVQRTHIHGSPDGPWFFIIARSLPDKNRYELLGITDTSMLRPQVFALYENHADQPIQIGLIASERQAINACLRSLSEEDERFQPVADKYWVARGGSYENGGAFQFTLDAPEGTSLTLKCNDKFGNSVDIGRGYQHVTPGKVDPDKAAANFRHQWEANALHAYDDGGTPTMWSWLKPAMASIDWHELSWGLNWLIDFGREGDAEWEYTRGILNLLRDRYYNPGVKKRASILASVDRALGELFSQAPGFNEYHNDKSSSFTRGLNWQTRHTLRAPHNDEGALLLNALDFPPEGDESAARWMARAYQLGWKHMIVYNWRGGRFAACGLGAESLDARIELYGDTGDYSGSGLDGAQVHIHGDGQDQLGQIMKNGKLIIHGDVGQTFLYGAKGGEVYVLGSAAGRPLINAVGKPRAVINGTCLDYLAESFMAGDPHQGGGFIILNGVTFDQSGNLIEMGNPYPGGNLFSLASGGAIFLRDPYHRVVQSQLNGGVLCEVTATDWNLIKPYLDENERLFDIRVDDLLSIEGQKRTPSEVYRKVQVGDSSNYQEGENR